MLLLEPIVLALMAVQPNLSRDKASLYSHLIQKASIKLNLDWRVIVGIGMQESSWLPTNSPDLGLFQLHKETAKHYQVDIEQFSEEGSLRYTLASFKYFTMVMQDKLNECRKYGEDAWSCYHSKTPSHRTAYLAKVGRYLKDE